MAALQHLRAGLADGGRIIGKKIGVTSEAVQKMLDVDQPDFGFLMDTMQYADGAEISSGHRPAAAAGGR